MAKLKLPPVILDLIENQKSLSQLLILGSFLMTFFLVRVVTHLQKANILGSQSGTVHIHHLVPGIILLIISGFMGISFWNFNWFRHLSAILFGIGAALTIDEFALWLFLQDVYWEKQGRDSIDAVVFVVVLAMIIIVLSHARIRKLIKKLFKSNRS